MTFEKNTNKEEEEADQGLGNGENSEKNLLWAQIAGKVWKYEQEIQSRLGRSGYEWHVNPDSSLSPIMDSYFMAFIHLPFFLFPLLLLSYF